MPGLSRMKAARRFVDLDERDVPRYLDDFANELVFADADRLGHLDLGHAVSLDRGAADPDYLAFGRQIYLLSLKNRS
jgi:hypothetical protein